MLAFGVVVRENVEGINWERAKNGLSGLMGMFGFWRTCGLYGCMPFLGQTAETFHLRSVHFTVFKLHLNYKNSM